MSSESKKIPGSAGTVIEYPVSRSSDTMDSYHGNSIPDPFQWMEDIRSDETVDWITRQNELTDSYLDSVPGRKTIFTKLMSNAAGERLGLPYESGGRFFQLFNDGNLDQDLLQVRESMDGAATTLLDPAKFSNDGSVSLNNWMPSRDGNKLLYARSESGSDWCTWQVRDVSTGRDLDDAVMWGKYGNASWDAIGSGFYYLRYPTPEAGAEHTGGNRDSTIYYHRLGTSQQEDIEVFSMTQEPESGIFFSLNEAADMLLFYVSRRGRNGHRIFVSNADPDNMDITELIDNDEDNNSFIGNDGDRLWFRTSHGSPNLRVVQIDRRNPSIENWKELIGESEFPLQDASLYGGNIVCHYMKDASSHVSIHRTDGSFMGDVELPGRGSVEGMGGKAESDRFFIAYTDAITPEQILVTDATGFQVRMESGRPATTGGASSPDTSDYVASTVFYTSKDGTKVPIHIAHHRDTVLDGSNPTILYGYGGFNIAQLPKFTAARFTWLELGGVFAIASIRGGSEYGQTWHQSATKLNRQKAYDDFIAAAEFLINRKYTSTGKLAIQGRSNGGLLVGAVMAQRPDLFAVALPQVGVMDMLRFNKFTAGPHWEGDFGTPQNVDEFAAIRKYSPLHNLHSETCYPATMITTGDTDDRVVPSHSYKFAARLQEVQSCDRPCLIRIDCQAGHGQGKPIAQEMREFADQYAFALHNMGVTVE